jgi:hypothetical protein
LHIANFLQRLVGKNTNIEAQEEEKGGNAEKENPAVVTEETSEPAVEGTSVLPAAEEAPAHSAEAPTEEGPADERKCSRLAAEEVPTGVLREHCRRRT